MRVFWVEALEFQAEMVHRVLPQGSQEYLACLSLDFFQIQPLAFWITFVTSFLLQRLPLRLLPHRSTRPRTLLLPPSFSTLLRLSSQRP